MNDAANSKSNLDTASAPRDPLAFGALKALPWRMLLVTIPPVVAVCAIFVTWVDQPVANYFKSLNETGFVAAFRIITHLGESGVWYALAVVAALALWLRSRRAEGDFRWLLRRRVRSMVFVVVSMATSGTLVNVLKMIFGRYRPRYLFEDSLYGFVPFALDLKKSGFPSGHTQSIFAAMVACGFIWPRWRAVFWSLAVLVGASRFIITVHYTADVIAGAYVAIVIALIMRNVFERNGIPLAWSANPPR
ncbi:MAG: phosphatase PAP2 family protein [Rhodobacteraceae bacterium]|nr:phosphatase PAP2 family protein [Paracoccaceae bacterium]